MMPLLETDKLVIKGGIIEDYVKVHEYDFNYLQNIDGVFEYKKRDSNEVRSWFNTSIENFYKNIREKNYYDFIIYIKESGEPIVHIGFDRNDTKLKSTEISCYLHPRYWGNGYMMEALITCMEYLFNSGFENIIYSYNEKNVKSKKLAEKIGFIPCKQTKENNCFGNPTILYNNIMSRDLFSQIYKKKEGKNIKK